jgi:hypothetical protein
MKVLDLETLELKSGGHRSVDEGVCLMEAVAWFNNEPHSDHPGCASPVLTRFGIGLNDAFTDEQRQKLKPLIPKLVGTRNDALEQLRYEYLLNASLNVLIPIGLRNLADRIAVKDFDLAERFRKHARQFEELPKIKYDRDRALALALARDRDRALALARDRDRALDRALALDLALDRALDLDRDRDRDLDLDRDLALDLDLALDRALDLDCDLDCAPAPPDQKKVWEAAIEIFEKAIDLKAEEVAE